MHSLFTYLHENDKYRQDFVAHAAKEGLVRDVCTGPNAEPLNEEELAVVKQKED